MHSHPSPFDIQSHLYSSFLHASTYDVALKVSGTWSAIYKLHRVVLIQSGFFRSLFTGGFSESAIRHVDLRNGKDEIILVFDDHNITRPAFEVCISRLYGGGPVLYVSPSIIPTTKQPFIPPSKANYHEVPDGSQPATPRFLLSLLATSIYLSIPSVASQALSLILKTVGPTTVIQYLNFACGQSLSQLGDCEEDSKAAVGLDNVAQVLDDEQASRLSESYAQSTISTKEWTAFRIEDDPTQPYTVESSSESSESESAVSSRRSSYYGSVSDKIGEACACWLTRWAVDVLQLETEEATHAAPNHDPRTRSKSLSSFDPKIAISASFASRLKAFEPPTIFRVGGLSAKWVSVIVSADTLFIKGEKQRYNFARSIVELRRRNGILDAEERVWKDMFERGIYYSNMSFEDLLFISKDISPVTGRPYVSQSVLDASNWTQSLLRQQIMHRNSTSFSVASNQSPSARDKELGIALTTADILSEISKADDTEQENSFRNKFYFPVLDDSSLRIGENGAATATLPPGSQLTMDDIFNMSQSPTPKRPSDQVPSHHIGTTEETFFGIAPRRFSAEACIKADPDSKCRWTPYAPYRFSVEFWDLDLLKEKSRLHSQTIWHAGNMFNVYVQVVRKKGQAQLGIYLHRQSSVDPIPVSSTPSTLVRSLNSGNDEIPVERGNHLRQPSLPSMHSISPHYSPSIHPLGRSTTPSTSSSNARSRTPPSAPSSPTASPFAFNAPATSTTSAPQQPYRDPRQSVSAYFAISCASATGSSQTRFSSSPDVFSVSQSWGWKSSTLRTEDFMEVTTQPLTSTDDIRGDEISFRATVLLGLV